MPNKYYKISYMTKNGTPCAVIVGASNLSRVTWYTGAQGHGIQFAYTKFLLFFCLIFCLCQHQILLF